MCGDSNNGFSRRPHWQQTVAYLVIAYVVFCDFGILDSVDSSDTGVQAFRRTLSAVLLLSILVSTLLAAGIDPTDPISILYRKSVKEGKWFDVMKYEMFCELCDAHVSDSSKHCKRCNRCVSDFDHHCKWINNCIGASNYRPFFVMVASVSVYSLWQLIQQIRFIAGVGDDKSAGYKAMIYIGFVVTLVVLILVANLTGLHVWLMSKGMTTFQYILKMREADEMKKAAFLARQQSSQMPPSRVSSLSSKEKSQIEQKQNQQNEIQVKVLACKVAIIKGQTNDRIDDQKSKCSSIDHGDDHSHVADQKADHASLPSQVTKVFSLKKLNRAASSLAKLVVEQKEINQISVPSAKKSNWIVSETRESSSLTRIPKMPSPLKQQELNIGQISPMENSKNHTNSPIRYTHSKQNAIHSLLHLQATLSSREKSDQHVDCDLQRQTTITDRNQQTAIDQFLRDSLYDPHSTKNNQVSANQTLLRLKEDQSFLGSDMLDHGLSNRTRDVPLHIPVHDKRMKEEDGIVFPDSQMATIQSISLMEARVVNINKLQQEQNQQQKLVVGQQLTQQEELMHEDE